MSPAAYQSRNLGSWPAHAAVNVVILDPNVVYAGTADLGGWGTGGLFKSVDGGISWQKLSDGATYVVLIDPANPDKPNSFSAGPRRVACADGRLPE